MFYFVASVNGHFIPTMQEGFLAENIYIMHAYYIPNNNKKKKNEWEYISGLSDDVNIHNITPVNDHGR